MLVSLPWCCAAATAHRGQVFILVSPSPIATSGTVVAEDSVPGPSGSTLPPSVGSASRQQG